MVSNQLIDKLGISAQLKEKELRLFGQLVEVALFSFDREIKEVEKKDFDSFFLSQNG